MMEAQATTGAFVPATDEEDVSTSESGSRKDRPMGRDRVILEQAETEAAKTADAAGRFNVKHQSLARPALRPATPRNWMFEAVRDLTK